MGSLQEDEELAWMNPMAGGGGFGSSSSLGLGQSILDSQYTQQQLESFQATAESDLVNKGDLESSENLEAISCDDSQGAGAGAGRPQKKKRYHRHTSRQIQEMERYYERLPHPDDKMRKELARELGLEPLQVKFWFQNKRTQTKNHQERQENNKLRAENEKLRVENQRYREALAGVSCPNCGASGPVNQHHLLVKNAQLRDEIQKLTLRHFASYPLHPGGIPSRPIIGNVEECLGGELAMVEEASVVVEKPVMIDVAVAAMDEFLRVAQLGEPLWLTGFDGVTQILNEEEYLQDFPRGTMGPKPIGFKTEGTRGDVVLGMNAENFVDILMNVKRWASVFSGIVSRSSAFEVCSTGVAGNYNGVLQLITAEYYLLSPLVPPRECLFIRYCKQHSEKCWAVVDVSLDSARPIAASRCRKRPSGCLIQELPNGLTKVVWVEHVESDDSNVSDLYKPLVNTGLAFGAKRWIAMLDRHCERVTSVLENNIDFGMPTSQNGKGMLKLAERLVRSFCDVVCSSPARGWSTVNGASQNVKVTSRRTVDDPGRPNGTVLNATTSFWLPVPPRRLFDFLRDVTSRNEWDILSSCGAIYEMAHINIGRDQGNFVSLLGVNGENSCNGTKMMLQENYSDATGAYVIYTPVDMIEMKVVLNGGDPDYVVLLPSGFAIFPDLTSVPVDINGMGSEGSLLTVSFQILAETLHNKLLLGSVSTVNSLLNCTVERIKAALGA